MKNGQAPWRKKLKYKRGGSSSGGGGGVGQKKIQLLLSKH